MRAACEHEHGTDTSPLGVPKPSRTDLLSSITPWAQMCPAPWSHAGPVQSGHCRVVESPYRTGPHRSATHRRNGVGGYFSQTLSWTR